MEDQPTCGKGLAANAVLPANMAALLESLADNLETHTGALDLEDEHSRTEHKAYVHLVSEYREIAARLQTTAREMAGYRDLPMGKHDEQALLSPKVLEVFKEYVQLEEELLALLQEKVQEDGNMLAEMEKLIQ
jgi:hypothetical protein